ncbi:formate dehydrogenase accessory sulfurtransferase FdhD [Microbulbifer sp. Q7]|uniref:formate dehydrogenase accessory sulfurtransferase FdhD n=1 Tax=Microbulbifer sp. Q7 TaxID=1785091 RepID=UPI00082BCBB4|nr:formate dehydrogenase accessory sulfurtransferase FdhD [Microbulbifer sp. Q7]
MSARHPRPPAEVAYLTLSGSEEAPLLSAACDAPQHQVCHQLLAQEVAVAFCYNGISHAVMMASPDGLEDFAYGFSFCAGVIEHRDQILDLELTRDAYPDPGLTHDPEGREDAIQLNITLSQRAASALRASRRSLAGSSGCGVCGSEALAQVLAPPTGQTGDRFAPLPPTAFISNVRQRFRLVQQSRHASGAMHSAIYVDADGTTRLCREDIGRHNALDKLIGACLREGLDLTVGFVALTSRCSHELIQKALRARIGTLVSLASPSDMAVRWARRHCLNLVHLPVQGAARLYSGLRVGDPRCEHREHEGSS